MLKNLNDILPEAKSRKEAVGHFNINGQLWIENILKAAVSENSPVILATSDRMVDYLGGFKTIQKLVLSLIDYYNIEIPVVLHLDHGQTIERCFEAIDAGYSSVMFDGSHEVLEKNIELTRKVVDYAHNKNVSVEAEIGTVGGNEDGVIGGINYADLNECIRLVDETGIDALAAALGSVHGPYQGEPKLGFAEMRAISEAISIPLVLHGASGIPTHQIRKAIELGHAKINVNTELNLAWKAGLIDSLRNYPTVYEPKILQELSAKNIYSVVKEKIREFKNLE
ncbi:ketose-bisphosphate aldolase [Enterococcus sp. HY326]|uniref:ketose-bisphosphate aldolase n=1 Tax=Enterococcus sp. HY326 TaxID=2971265 RepID=UPI00223EE5B5|nr:ketose-bisphosphate aldolase [Enterococcus sp. HY326]